MVGFVLPHCQLPKSKACVRSNKDCRQDADEPLGERCVRTWLVKDDLASKSQYRL